MGKSSIHILPVKLSSERHNERQKKLDYVREDLSHLNSSFKFQSIAEAKSFAERNCKEKTGRSMQAKATPIREGVLLIEEHHTAEDIKNLAKKIENRFGIKTIQGYCHKDEGHYEKSTKEWKPNYHAHMVFDWTDHLTGKSIKMNREDMTELQTLVAESLGLERGANSSVKHLNSIQFKNSKEESDLKMIHGLKNGLLEAKKTIEIGNAMENQIESLKMAKNSLENENDLLRANKNYLEKKTEEQRKELKAIEEQKKSKGFKI